VDILQLKLFVSLSHTLNFSRTAELYYLSQPSVSHHIRALERKLGVTLFRRDSHRVYLTPEGEEYLPYARQILALVSEGETRLQNIALGHSGRLRVAALSSAALELSAALARLYAVAPLIQVDVDLLEGAEMIEALGQRRYDFYFAADPMLPAGVLYQSTLISSEHLCLYAHSSVVQDIDLSDWSTVEPHPFVSVPPADATLTRQIRQLCHHHNITPRISNYYNRAESLMLAVNAGVGIAILPAPFGRLYAMPDVISLPIREELALQDIMCAWDIKSTNSASPVFRDVVCSLFPSGEQQPAQK
jgi:DNA-binding transcriptional LysR family regulator